METQRRPSQKIGEQNYQCPHYDLCVDDITNNDWHFWTCSDCVNKLSGTGVSLCSSQARVNATETVPL